MRDNQTIVLVVIVVLAAWLIFGRSNSKVSQVAAPTDPWFQKEVVEQETPVLVKFGATWCGPCRAMEPTLAKLSKSMEGKLKIVDIDVDKNGELAEHYGVSSIPRLLLLDQGKVVGDRIGADSVENLERWIQPFLAKSKQP